MKNEHKEPSLLLALVPVAMLVGILAYAIRVLNASPHIPIILGCVVAVLVGFHLGYNWKTLQEGMVKGISIAMPSVLILFGIGLLIGSWMASGVVPLLIVYGLRLLSPEIFLVATCIICAVVAIATGSSWTTASTIGVALIGVGEGLEVSKAMTAGAIVSGAYFGDKLSPLSDTTNLAAAVAEVPLFTHIRHMLWTTVPSMVIALVIYAALGMGAGGEANSEKVTLLIETITENFNLTPLLLLAPASVIACLVFKMPALPAILIGAASGAILGMTVQGVATGDMYVAMQEGYKLESGVSQLDELLSGGGMESMFWTIGIVLCALAFGGLLECTGMLATIGRTIMRFAIGTGRLVVATLASCLGMNLLASDQYLSIVMPGRMYKDAFEKAGLDGRNLSRCLEDAGTITSPLIPWNTCGATMLGALKVDPFAFAPYAFFNLLCPLVSAVFGFTGWTMKKAVEGEEKSGS
ncbi:MAG: Na+/H+ antiporter NhaC [Roseibacillus sp.]